jgi:hypothetical protein
MKLKLNELNPNPFKKQINGGKLKEEIIKKIQANIKELGLMGSLPVYKKNGKYFLIAGHHRLEALKRAYGKNFQVECTIHNYTEENVLRGMIVENLTQRSDELLEVTENLNAIRTWLKHNCSPVEHLSRKKDKLGRTQSREEEAGSTRNIYSWLNKNGEVMSTGKISEYLKVYDNLDRSLLRATKRTEGGVIEEDKISIKDAINLARLEKKDQKPMKEILDKTELNKDAKGKLITEFLAAPKELKEKVLSEEVNVMDVPIENLKDNIRKKIAEQKEEDKGKIVVTHYKQFERQSGNRIGKTNNEIIQTCAFLNGLENSGILYDLDWKTMLKIVEGGADSGSKYNKFMERIIQKIK